MDKNSSNKPEDLQVVETLQRIKNGLLNSESLSKESRQLCVEALILEGYQPPSIASLMKKSDRTIRRDTEEIRQRNSLKSSPELSRMLVGELLVNARNQYARLKQLARLPESSSDEKARTEFLAWRVYKELIDMLYFVGFLVNDDAKVQPFPFLNNNKEDANMSDADKKIMKECSLMPPMAREMLVERLHKEIMKLDKEIDEESNGEENKKGEPPLKE
jgi:hypothetical protein